jgi:lipid-A-disaccharide synthase-like uncharacterized protein
MGHWIAVTVVFFNIFHADLPKTFSEWAWKLIGLGGGAVFGGRFFLQWIHSERHGEVKIPTSFWWLSVLGTLMTAAFCIHQRQWILLLSNGPQLVPYSRNLVLIYRKKREKFDDEDIAK